jgi:hypothetical protein
LNFVYNSAKHANKTIASGQMPNEGTIPVWITNDGLNSRTAYVTFAELAEAIEEVARFADLLSNPEAPPADPSPKAAAGG